MKSSFPLRPDELDDDGAGYRDEAAAAAALRLARELESAAILDPVHPRSDFTDSVMAAIEREPSPRPYVAIVGPLRTDGVRGIWRSIRGAVATVTLGSGRPLAARAAAFAYLVVVGALGLALSGGAAVGAASALGLFDGRGPEPTPVVLPSGSPDPSPSTDPLFPTPGPSGSPDGSASPDPSASSGSGGSPAPSASPSETPDGSETPRPSRTPRASETPDPSDTPDPGDTPNP